MSETYWSRGQQTVLRVVGILGERPLEGVLLADVAERAGATRDQVFRALKNLELAGWAERGAGGGWRLRPEVTRLSERVRVAIADLHRSYLEGWKDERDD